MRILSLIVVVAALVLAGGVYFFAARWVDTRPDEQAAPEPEQVPAVRVLVAAETMPAGTLLDPDKLRWQRWPEEGLNEGFVTDRDRPEAVDEFAGASLKFGVPAGQPLTDDRIVRPEDTGFLANVLTPGMRAVSIRIDAVSGTAGFVMPGDRVDVILTQTYSVQPLAAVRTGAAGRQRQEELEPPVGSKRVGETILENVRVLAIDQSVKDIEGQAKLGKTATLEVTAEQAQKVAIAREMGPMSLALRNPSEEPSEVGEPRVTEDTEVSRYLANIWRDWYRQIRGESVTATGNGGGAAGGASDESDAAPAGGDKSDVASGGSAGRIHIYRGITVETKGAGE